MRRRRAVLCVDADEGALSRRAFLLETRRRLTVLQASSGLAALELLRQLPSGTVAVLVTEFDLRDMDGEELVRRVREIDPAVRSLVTSGTRGPWVSRADVFLPNSGFLGNAELVERVTALAVRRTGPKREPAMSVGARRTVELVIRGLA